MTALLAPLLLALPTTIGPRDDSSVEPLDVVSALEQAVVEAIETARPSVVTIDRIKSEDGSTQAVRGRNEPAHGGQGGMIVIGGLGNGPEGEDYVSYDFGSGVVIGDDGQILTNYHVVTGAARLIVRAPGLTPFDAEIIAADPRSDLAVIAPVEPQLDEDRRSVLNPIIMGDASTLRPGSFLVALGNAHNASRDGKASASFGILANTARRLIAPPDDLRLEPIRQLQHYATLFQLDSKLNLGMSGGAVVNLKGEFVALTTASANAVGYDPRAGYAIPMDKLGRRIVDALVQGKEVEYGFLGIRLERAKNVVTEVQPGTPAGEGGLVAEDQIVEVDGMTVTDFDSLIQAVNASPVGEPVSLKIIRDGRTLEKEIVLSKFPVSGEVIATNRPEPWRGARIDYSSVVGSVNPTIDLLEAMARGGVGVVEVAAGSPAETARLRPGMIISTVEGRRVRSPDEFRRVVAEYDGQPVRLGIAGALEDLVVPPRGPVDDD